MLDIFDRKKSVLIQDTARPHVVKLIQQFLHGVEIDVMDWPANSPDLHPI